MKILYGTMEKNINVTEICYNRLINNNIITIPSDDFIRASYFTDPHYGISKKVFIIDKKTNIFEYDVTITVKINIITEEITTDISLNEKLENIQNKLQLKYASFTDELPEQRMATRYLTGNEKVLEIGSNIGRNSLIIGYILRQKNNNNFVTMECDMEIIDRLKENRNINNFNFYIESSALSTKKLIQRGMDTIPSDTLLDGYNFVNTITLKELYAKYNIIFDTLVLDCEGAFYYILMDMPEILNNINLILMENDYWDISKKNYVDDILKKNNFYVDYSEPGGYGPCQSIFYEVWKKSSLN